MKHFKPSPFSLQKEIVQRNICLKSEIDRSICQKIHDFSLNIRFFPQAVHTSKNRTKNSPKGTIGKSLICVIRVGL